MSRCLLIAAAMLLTAGAISMAHAQYLPAPNYAYAPYGYGYPYYPYGYYPAYNYSYSYYPTYYYSPSFPYNPTPGMAPESTAPRLMGSVKAP